MFISCLLWLMSYLLYCASTNTNNHLLIITSILRLAFALSLNFEVYIVYIYEDRDSEFQIALMLPACSKQILPNKDNTIWISSFQDKPRKGVFVYLFRFVLEELFNTLSCYHSQDYRGCNWMNVMKMTSIILFGDNFLLFWS